MANVTLHFRPEIERMLRERASRQGQTLEKYLEQLAEREGEADGDADAHSMERGRQLTDSEFDRLLDELSAGSRLSHLPVDFSRADIYSDHD